MYNDHDFGSRAFPVCVAAQHHLRECSFYLLQKYGMDIILGISRSGNPGGFQAKDDSGNSLYFYLRKQVPHIIDNESKVPYSLI